MKRYIKPQIEVQHVTPSNIICSSLDGEADPNKPSLAKEINFDLELLEDNDLDESGL